MKETKDTRFEIRLSTRELNKLDNKAKKLGITRSELIRKWINNER